MTNTTTPRNTAFIPAITNLAKQADEAAKNAWLGDYRRAQIAALAQAEFPHAKIEHFKYNRFDVFEQHNFDRFATTSEPIQLDSRLIEGLEAETIERAVFLNGRFSPALSQLNAHRVTEFAAANEAQQQKILAMLQAQDVSHNPFIQYNAGVSDEGVLIEIDEKSPNSILEVLSIIGTGTSHASLATQVLIDVADNSKASVVSRSLNWVLSRQNASLSTQRILANIGKNATLTHYHLQLENPTCVHFGSVEYNLQSHSTLKAFYGATGGTLKKMDVTVNHLGQHAHAFLDGLYAASDKQQIDFHTTVNHPLPNGETDEIFRGIVNGQAEVTFNGRIHIFEDAQKTRAELSNKNLILSDDASIHTKPELEIYADDVVCAHGATISRMNDESLNYLRARSIAKEEAELMLSYGFFNELLDNLEHQAVGDYLRPILFKRFDEAF